MTMLPELYHRCCFSSSGHYQNFRGCLLKHFGPFTQRKFLVSQLKAGLNGPLTTLYIDSQSLMTSQKNTLNTIPVISSCIKHSTINLVGKKHKSPLVNANGCLEQIDQCFVIFYIVAVWIVFIQLVCLQTGQMLTKILCGIYSSPRVTFLVPLWNICCTSWRMLVPDVCYHMLSRQTTPYCLSSFLTHLKSARQGIWFS